MLTTYIKRLALVTGLFVYLLTVPVDGQGVLLGATCSGVNVPAGTANVNDLVQAETTGTTFCFFRGTYPLDEKISPKSYDKFIGRNGTIFDGDDTIDYGFDGVGTEGGTTNVQISRIEFTSFTNTAIDMGWYWKVFRNNIHHNKIGVTGNSYSTLDNNHIHQNTQYGITGGGDDFWITNNEVDNNNTSLYCGGTCTGDAGGSKIVGSAGGARGIIWRNNNVHDNLGPGIWSDGNVRALYEYNTVERNDEVGIFHEISWDAIIRFNTVRDNANDVAGMSCFWGSQIHVNTSTNVQIHDNIVSGANGENGICVVASNRGDAEPPYPTGAENVDVFNNEIHMNGSAESGIVFAEGESYAGSSFENNDYYVPDDTLEWWTWPTDVSAAWAAWQALGNDDTGSVTEE